MPKTAIVRKGGTTVVIEAHAEITTGPTAPLGKWATVFRERLEDKTREFTPFNKRPRWQHYGPMLRRTFSGAIRHNPVKGRVDFAVGSSADHALYVDQGTGIYNGGTPWRAKILPPYKRQQGSLYEASWIAGRRRVKPVWIKGQRPQNFMQRGLDRTMQSMLNRHYQLPDDPRMAAAEATAPRTLTAFLGGTPNDSAFRGELERWRQWRDKAWNSGRELGDKGARKRRRDVKKYRDRMKRRRYTPTPDSELTDEQKQWQREREAQWLENRAERRRENARRYRERVKSGRNRKPDRSLAMARSQEKARFRAHLVKTYGSNNVDKNILMRDGRWEARVRERVRLAGGHYDWKWTVVTYKPKTTSKGRRR